MLHGVTITLYQQTTTGTDAFNRPIYNETPISVENVLISPVTDAEVLDTLELTGRKAVYQLAIPKGDVNDWENKKVSFFGQDFRTIGIATEGISDLIPLAWNKKVKVERYGE